VSAISSCETNRHEHHIGSDLQHSLDNPTGEEVVHSVSMASTAIAMPIPADSSMPGSEMARDDQQRLGGQHICLNASR
jgi:hypothetical protein